MDYKKHTFIWLIIAMKILRKKKQLHLNLRFSAIFLELYSKQTFSPQKFTLIF
jgi:hypothetical protein